MPLLVPVNSTVSIRCLEQRPDPSKSFLCSILPPLQRRRLHLHFLVFWPDGVQRWSGWRGWNGLNCSCHVTVGLVPTDGGSIYSRILWPGSLSASCLFLRCVYMYIRVHAYTHLIFINNWIFVSNFPCITSVAFHVPISPCLTQS